MRKIAVIAQREYAAAVRSKAFVISMTIMPILMFASAGLQVLFKKLDDAKEKRLAVIDRSPNRQLELKLKETVEERNQVMEKDPKRIKDLGPKYKLEIVEPSDPTAEAMNQQRYELSRRIDKGDLEAFVEIGPDIYTVGERLADPTKVDDSTSVRIQAKNPMHLQFRRWVDSAINDGVQFKRFQEHNVDRNKIEGLQTAVVFKTKSLTRRDPKTGDLVEAADHAQFVNLFLPAVLIGLMFMIIMVGATPAMHGIVEEKSQRIAEVLLGSATPFQLMAGKLGGIIGVALTMTAVYLAGGYYLAWHFEVAEMVPASLFVWFVVMLTLALLIFGSLFIAVGAAASDIKDTQTLLMPIMMIACLPFFALGPIMQDPNGPIARACSFFPFATPMLLVARESVPPGVPWPEMAAGILLVLATTWFCVWAAGRIFRVGILMQGKGPRLVDLMRWVMRG